MKCKICKNQYNDPDDMFNEKTCQKCWLRAMMQVHCKNLEDNIKELVEHKGKPYVQKLLDNILD